MLKINDLTESKTLDSKAMRGVIGGWNPFAIMADGSTTQINKVADIDQVFELNFAQGNIGEVINNQAISGGNGRIIAPVKQTLDQDNTMRVYDIGNTSIR